MRLGDGGEEARVMPLRNIPDIREKSAGGESGDVGYNGKAGGPVGGIPRKSWR